MCDKVYVKQGNLVNHRIRHFKSPEEVEHFYCVFCPRSFRNKSKLKKHLKTHTTPSHRMFKCSFCKEPFYLVTSLTQHVLMECVYAHAYRASVMTQAYRAIRDQVKRSKCHSGAASTNEPVSPHHTQKFQCAFCFEFFEKSTLLAKHLSSKHMNAIVG